MEKYKGKKIELTGQAVNANKTYSPRGFGLNTDVKASRAKGVLKQFAIAFEVDLPPEQRKTGWALAPKQKVVVTAELAEVTDAKIRLTNATFKKAKSALTRRVLTEGLTTRPNTVGQAAPCSATFAVR